MLPVQAATGANADIPTDQLLKDLCCQVLIPARIAGSGAGPDFARQVYIVEQR
jgi:hypothetical protein